MVTPENFASVCRVRRGVQAKFDIWELFSGSGILSAQALLHGFSSGPPIDFRYGFDMAAPRHFDLLMKTLRSHECHVLFASPDSRLWMPKRNEKADKQTKEEKQSEHASLNNLVHMLEFQSENGRKVGA